MSVGRRKVARSILSRIEERIDAATAAHQVGVIRQLSPLKVELLDDDRVLEGGANLTLAWTVEQYAADYGLAVGDNLLISKRSGSWVASDVLADATITARDVFDDLAVNDTLTVGTTITIGGDVILSRDAANVLATSGKLRVAGELEVDGALNHDGSTAGFLGAAPIAQQAQTVDLKDLLVSFGLMSASGAATPLNLDGGAFSAGATSLSGVLDMNANKVTELAAATANGDAVRYEQAIGPGARATRASFSHNSSGSWLSVALTAESHDTDNLNDNVTNNSRITVPKAGKYAIAGYIQWDNNTTGVIRSGRILVNGVTIVTQDHHPPSSLGLAGPTNSMADVFELAANDYVEIQGFQDSGGTRTIHNAVLAVQWQRD